MCGYSRARGSKWHGGQDINNEMGTVVGTDGRLRKSLRRGGRGASCIVRRRPPGGGRRAGRRGTRGKGQGAGWHMCAPWAHCRCLGYDARPASAVLLLAHRHPEACVPAQGRATGLSTSQASSRRSCMQQRVAAQRAQHSRGFRQQAAHAVKLPTRPLPPLPHMLTRSMKASRSARCTQVTSKPAARM